MATSQDLFLSILALDAYNRRDDRGMAIPGLQTAIGTATITGDGSSLAGAAGTTFYALAYNWELGRRS